MQGAGRNGASRRASVWRVLLATLLVAASVTVAAPLPRADAGVVRSFGKLFSQQTNGSIAITGNVLQTCPASASCTSALNGTSVSSNNNFTMTYLDADGLAGTTSSSSATVTIPTGARVLYAGLFWGAARVAGQGGSPSNGAANQIKFRVPGSTTYTTLTADTIDSSGLQDTNDYSAYKNVTTVIQGAGSGAYWGADIAQATGVDRYGAWSLVIAIGDPTAPLRDLNVFNGYATLTNTETANTTISGFLAPPTGAVSAKFGSVVYEGDASITGDYMTVGSTRLADSESPSANFFGSRITANGANLADRTPASLNNLGLDAKVVNAPGVVPNGATSANITFSTTGDYFYPAVLTTQIDLYAPTINGLKTVTDLNGNSPAKSGDTLEYTMTFTNSGDDSAINSVIEDTLPANTTYVPGSLSILTGANTGTKTDAAADDQAEYVAASRLVRYRVGTGASGTAGGTLATNGTTKVRFQVIVAPAASGTTISNEGLLSYNAATIGTRYTYQTADADTPVANLADLSVTKTAAPEPVTAGNNVTYTLRAANAGPTSATGVVVTDTLPAGVTLVSSTPTQGTCTSSGQTVSCAVGTIATGGSATVAVVVTVPAASTATALTDVAEVSSTTSDPNTANNRATVTSTVVRSADVALTKTASPTNPVPGTAVTYTLVATNNGASNAVGVVVSDVLPSPFGGLSATTTAGTCTVSGNGVSCAVGTLAPGATATVRITGTLDAAYTGGALSNNGQVLSSTTDPTPANNTAVAVITPAAAQADLRVTKETVTSPVVAGLPVQYRITVTNAGPSSAVGVALSDPLPAALSGATATTSQGTCTVGATVACTIGALSSGSSAVVTVNAILASGATGTLANTATVSATTTDPTPGNNSSTVSNPVTASADLDIDKTATPRPVIDGQNVTYTLTVRNNGPSTARTVTVTDPVPAPLTYVSSTASQGTCTQAGGTVSCALGDLALGATATVTVVAAVPGAGGANGLANTAVVGSATPDPVTSNNSATYTLLTGAQANLVMTKTAAPATVTAGQAITFTLTARNDGPSNATGVTITDTVPASVSGVAASTATSGASCTVTGNAVSCTAPNLANGASLVATVTGTVTAATGAGTLSNTASVNSALSDPSPSDNSATSSTPIQTRADVSVAKTGPATIVAGNQLTWTIVAANAGPSDALSTTVVDQLPSGVTFVSATGTGVSCTPGPTTPVALVNCTITGALAPGATRTITLVGLVDSDTASGSTLTNAATISSATTDPVTTNNTSSVPTTVTTSVNVSLTKTVSPTTLTAGAEALYSLTAHNGGPSTALAVSVGDTLPASLTVLSATFDGGSCTVTGQQVSCTRARLGVNADAVAQIRVRVSPTQTADVVNSGSVSSSTPDPTPGDNTASTTTPVVSAADLVIVKSVDRQSVTAGTGLTYTLTIVNNGPSTATAATVTDTLPAGLTYRSSTTTAGTCSTAGQTLSCALGDVAVGTPVTVTVSALIAATYAGATVANTATVSSPVTDLQPANNTSTATSDVVSEADLSIVKTTSPDTLVPGTGVGFTLVVTNAGPSAASAVVVRDSVPDGITITSAVWGPAATPCTVTGQDVVCTLSAVPVGQVVVSIDGALDSQYAAATLSNTATVESPTTDPDTTDRTSTATTTVVGLADLGIVKTMSPANPVAGQDVVFTITATNYGPSAAQSPQFIDQLPPGLTNVRVVPPPGATGCPLIPPVNPGTVDNPAAPTVTCSGPIFRAGFTVSGTITATITPGFTGTLVNLGRTSADTLDPVASNNESTASGLVQQSADLSITKSVSPTTPVPGQPVTYTIHVANAGPSTATSVTVGDAVPVALTGVTATTSAGTCTVGTDNALSCAVGTVAPAASADITVTGTLRPDFTGTLSNTATVTSPTPDPDTTNNTATAAGSAGPTADVSIVKTMSPTSPVPGQQATYTLTVRNAGPSTATSVGVADQLDAGLSGASASSTTGSCSVDQANAMSCALGDLAPAATATITVTATLGAAFTGPLSNTATVTSPTPDPSSANNSSTVTNGTAPSSDVSVTKTMSPTSPIPGSAISYTVVVRNAGPSTATGVVATDQLNPAITQVTATADNGTACTVSAANLLSCPLGAMAPGAAITVSITGTLDPGFTGALPNTASATSTSPDPVGTNNSATVTGTAAPSADVSITKVLSPTIPVPGQPVRFSIAIRNDGPSTAVAVTVTDPLGAALLGPTLTTTGATCAIGAGNVLTCSAGSMAPGASAAIAVTGTLSPSFTGTLTNTATVSSTTPDPTTDNNTATAVGDGAPSADLSVIKTISPAAPVPGQQVTFTITASNAGPSTATAVTLTDQLNAALAGATTTTSQGTCAVDGSNVLSCALGDIAPEGDAVVTLTATLAAAYTGSLSNTADVASPTQDPDTSNNSVTVSGVTSPTADLVVTKALAPAQPVPGQAVSFTVGVRNAGPSSATIVTVDDQLDTAVAGATATSTAGTCTVSAGNAVVCAIGTLAPGAAASVTVNGTLDAGFTGTLSNTATAATATSEPNTDNNTATVTGATVPSADVSVTKTASPTAPIPGSAVGYTVLVHNDGPSAAAAVVLSDPLDLAVSAVTATADNGTTCTLARTNVVTCPLGTLAPGATVTISITGTLDAGFTGSLANTATAASSTPDPDTTNNAATVTGSAAPSADLSVTKTLSPTAPVPGQRVTFSIVVHNDGPSAATAVQLDDALGAALIQAAATSTAGSCAVDGTNALSCDLGTLAPDGTVTITVTAGLAATFTGTLSNTATVSSATADPDTSDNSATVTGGAAAQADVSLTKTLSPTRPVPGQPVTFQLTIHNTGPSDAAQVAVSDTLDAALSDLTAVSTAGTCTVDASNLLECAVGAMATGSNVTVTVTGTLASGFVGDLSNTATVTSSTPDDTPANNTSTVTGTATPAADVSIVKMMAPVTPVPGQQVTFTLSVRNTGPSDAADVTVVDPLDAALTGAIAVSTAGICQIADNTVACALGTLVAGAPADTVTIIATLDSPFTGTLTNTATVATATVDPNPANNASTAVAGSSALADLSVVKTLSPTTPVPGAPVSFTITVHNDGPSTAAAVVVGDQLDVAISDVTATADNGTTCDVPGGSRVSCAIGAVASGGTVTVSVTGTLAADFVGRLTNTATADSPTADPDTSNNTSTVTGLAAPSADLAVTKSMSPAAPVPGQQVTYTLTVTNAGPSAAVAVLLTDLLSPALTGTTVTTTAGTCAVADGRLDCDLGPAAPGATLTITLTSTLSSSYTGDLPNTAIVSSPTADPDTTNNTSSVTGTAAPSADVSITKRVTPATPVPGDEVSFTLDVSNAGPSTATGVTVTDILDAALLAPSASTAGGTCTVGASNTLSCDLGAIASSGETTVVVQALLDPSFTGTLTNTATTTSDVEDPDPTNNSATASAVVAAAADLSITKTASPDVPVPGDTVQYTLTVRNAGPSTATAVAVADTLDAALLSPTATATVGTCAMPGGAISCDLGALLPGDVVTVTVSATLDPAFTGPLTNTATVSSPVPDPNADDNTSTVTATAAPAADLSVTKDQSPAAAVPGSAVTYTIVVDSAGPSTATGVQLVDQLDPSLLGATATSDNGATCAVSPTNELTCALGTVAAADDPITVTVTATLAPAFTGTLANTAGVDSPVPDPDVTNNSASVASTATPLADLSILKSMTPNSPVAGDAVSFTLVVDNAGPSTAVAVTVRDQLNPAIRGAVATTTTGSCVVDAADVLACDLGDLDPAARVTITVTGTLEASFLGILSNSAAVSSVTTDPDATNNTSSISGLVTPSADVSITKTVSPAVPVPGGQVVWTLTIANAGPSTAVGLVVTDQLPADLTAPTVTTTSGTCAVGTGALLSCSVATLGRTDLPVVVTVTGTLASDHTGPLTNTATVTADTPDPDLTDNTSTVTVTPVSSADLSVVKTADRPTAAAGGSIGYTLTVHNNGPSATTDAVVTDPLPASLTGPAATTTAGTCTITTGTLRCDLGAMAVGATVTITITATIDPAATAALTNTATVASTTPDPTADNNTSTVTVPLGTDVDVSITKTADPTTAAVGDQVAYTLTIANAGPSVASSVSVQDLLPAGLTPVGQPATDTGTCTLTGQGLTCDLGDLAPAGTATITLTALVATSAAGTTITNTATVGSACDARAARTARAAAARSTAAATDTCPDRNPANNTATATVTVAPPTPPPTPPTPPVTPVPPSPPLAYTGANITGQLELSLALLLAGAGLIWAGHRRRNASTRRA